MKKKLQLQTLKNLCRKARFIIVGAMVGDYREEFRRLFDYRDCTLQTNLGSTCVIDVFTEVEALGKPIKHIFKGMYVCFTAMKEGFSEGCRKCIGLDGCFLKGVFKGQILAAVVKNANNQIYPLAWAVVHNETITTWTWFLELLIKDLNLQQGKGIAIVADMQKVCSICLFSVI